MAEGWLAEMDGGPFKDLLNASLDSTWRIRPSLCPQGAHNTQTMTPQLQFNLETGLEKWRGLWLHAEDKIEQNSQWSSGVTPLGSEMSWTTLRWNSKWANNLVEVYAFLKWISVWLRYSGHKSSWKAYGKKLKIEKAVSLHAVCVWIDNLMGALFSLQSFI